MKYLIVVDMQNDFIDGALGSPQAQAIVPYVEELIRHFDGTVLFTRDTHTGDYMNTQEGHHLPVPHCIHGTEGWQIRPELETLRTTAPIDKPTFGSADLIEVLKQASDIESVLFVGLCTDICAISNVMLVKAFFPEVPVYVDARGCAGVTPESHTCALKAMEAVQVTILNANNCPETPHERQV